MLANREGVTFFRSVTDGATEVRTFVETEPVIILKGI